MYNACKVENLERLCKYIRERREGDFIETTEWSEECLSFPSISQKELDFLCQLFRGFVLHPNESISNRNGAIFFSISEN